MTNTSNSLKTIAGATCFGIFLMLLLLNCAIVAPAWADSSTSASTSSTASASSSTGLSDCPGELGAVYQKALNQSHATGVIVGRSASNDLWESSWHEYSLNPQGILPGLDKTFCLSDVKMYFDWTAGLLAGASMIDAAISSAISYFASTICNFAKSAIMSLVDSAMSLICIPLPDLSYSMSLPSLSRKSCNGYAPLRDMMRVDMVPGLSYSSLVPPDLLTAPLSRWIQNSGMKGFGYSIRNGRF